MFDLIQFYMVTSYILQFLILVTINNINPEIINMVYQENQLNATFFETFYLWVFSDSFDFSIVLCSLLIGVGYDAYVVIGTAPKKITTKDESLMECPFDIDLPDNESDDDPYYDGDEKLMQLEHTNNLNKVDDFEVVGAK